MKFKVEMIITETTSATYEIESESREQLYEDLDMLCVEDLGKCIKEECIHYDEEIDSVEPMEEK